MHAVWSTLFAEYAEACSSTKYVLRADAAALPFFDLPPPFCLSISFLQQKVTRHPLMRYS